ncbi:MAG: hypothetical protein ACUVRX_11210 [Actinomycetota bacterium]
MDERKRIEEKIKGAAGGAEEERLCLELLDTAYRGLEEGLSRGVTDEVTARLDSILEEMKGHARVIKEIIEK